MQGTRDHAGAVRRGEKGSDFSDGCLTFRRRPVRSQRREAIYGRGGSASSRRRSSRLCSICVDGIALSHRSEQAAEEQPYADRWARSSISRRFVRASHRCRPCCCRVHMPNQRYMRVGTKAASRTGWYAKILKQAIYRHATEVNTGWYACGVAFGCNGSERGWIW